MPRRDPALLKMLRLQIANARRLYLRDSKDCDERSLTGTDALVLRAGCDVMAVRYIRRDDAHGVRKSWSVRFSTAKPKAEELYDWLASLR